MNFKIGLIIQGPLDAPGIRGPFLRDKPLLKDKPRVTKNEQELYTDFDCTKNIINLANSADKYFDEIVLSTWQHSNLKILKKNKSISELIVNDENESRNYKNMFFSSKVACDYLDTKNLDFIVQVRTDLSVNLKLLYEECQKACLKNTILISNNIRDRKRFLEFDDLILGGISDFFIKWMKNVTYIDFGKPGGVHGSHSSLFISYLWTKFNSKSYLPKILFFHKNVINNSNKISNIAIKEWEGFHILDKHFWKDSKLRGEQLDRRYYDFEPAKPYKTSHKIKYNFRAFFRYLKNKYIKGTF